MYAKSAFVLILVVVSCVAGDLWFRGAPEFTVEIDKEHDDIIKLDLMKSLGFVCYNDEEGANNIAKVACGGEGKGVEVGDEGFKGTAEFSVKMTCDGTEAKLFECQNQMQAFEKCTKFVAAQCGGRRSLRTVI